ncbi:MAG: biotin carboxylase N-terminal domain-containing protein [Candidatus Thorarchaeota archaeon]
MIKTLLIANRGEIALRIERTCKKLGITPHFIYESADKDLPHALKKTSHPIESYMSIENIVKLGKKLDIDAIHPGYGFISENYKFPLKCREEGIEFVGPSPESMKKFGDKQEMLLLTSFAYIPRIPGRFLDINNKESILATAEELKYPLIVKGKESGGGRQIKVNSSDEELLDSVEKLKREKLTEVYISKFLTNVKHIEVQLLGDKRGNIISLSTRDCSIQRRYQKLIEEAPSSIPKSLQRTIEMTAIKIAHLGDYVNAGTIEFLVDVDNNFYFMEVNPRLQVEHTVTEEIFGLDLVEWQLKLANSEDLILDPTNIHPKGHAIQLRINAEDPNQNFVGTAGKILNYIPPYENNSYKVRIDTFIKKGLVIPAIYDSMIAKLIVHSDNRPHAIQAMLDAISKIKVGGIKTTLPFYEAILKHPIFKNSNHKTNYLNLYMEDLLKISSMCSFTQ